MRQHALHLILACIATALSIFTGCEVPTTPDTAASIEAIEIKVRDQDSRIDGIKNSVDKLTKRIGAFEPKANEHSVMVSPEVTSQLDQLNQTVNAQREQIAGKASSESIAETLSLFERKIEEFGKRLTAEENKPVCCPIPLTGRPPAKSACCDCSDCTGKPGCKCDCADCKCNPKPAKPKSAPQRSAVDRAIDKARDAGKKLAILFTQDKCELCPAFKSDVHYHEAAIRDRFDIFWVDAETDTATDRRFKVEGTPAVIVYDPETSDYHPGTVRELIGRSESNARPQLLRGRR